MKFSPLLIFGLSLLLSSCYSPSAEDDEYPLYYEHTYSEISLMNVDGTNDHKITDWRHTIKYANFLPNGQKIIYYDLSEHPQGLYLINPDGTGKALLASARIEDMTSIHVNDNERRILCTKDSKKILYAEYYFYQTSYGGYAHDFKDIYCVDIDGTNKVNISQTNGAWIVNGLSLSNDDRRVIYAEYALDSSSSRICISNIDGSNKTIVKTFEHIRPLRPQFLPSDNSVIVYGVAKQSDSCAICRFSLADPGNITTVCELASTVIQYQAPIITPANTMVLMGTSYPPGRVYSIDLLSGKVSSFSTDYIAGLSVSGDGASLVTFSYRKMTISALDGSGMTTLTSESGEDVRSPFLSPSKQQLIYVSLGSYQSTTP